MYLPGCHFLSASVAQPGSAAGGSRLKIERASRGITFALTESASVAVPMAKVFIEKLILMR